VVGTVAWISIAPVKALALVHPPEVQLEAFGVRENRRFYLVDEEGRLRNGKHLGPLVRVVPDYDEQANTLRLTFPDGSEAVGDVEVGELVTTVFYGRPVVGRLVVGPWSEALSQLAGTALQLIQAERPGGGVDRGAAGGTSLVSVAALDELARAAGIEGSVDGRRFRMLFGIDGVPAHEEDSWIGRAVQIGGATVVPHGNVGRCAVTTRHPETGIRDLDTLGALERYRGRLPTTEPLPFGVWAQVVEPGRVRLGDPVELVSSD
jgi:uncharacterized protein YcbX